MAVSRLSKSMLISAGVIAVISWLLIVEFGVNAGRIHYGVNLQGDLKVGGMTRSEALTVLRERADDMFYEPVVLGGEGIGPINVYPRPPLNVDPDKDEVRAVSWHPRYNKTVDALMDVGRKNGPVNSISDRFDAYFGGVEIRWQGAPLVGKVTKLVIDPIEELAAKQGLTLDRGKLRAKVHRALNEWPRKPFYRIPFE
jgi:hypothetical protein